MAHSHPDLELYKGILLICAVPNWRDGGQRISFVKFDLGGPRDTADQAVTEGAEVSEEEDDDREEEIQDEDENEEVYFDGGENGGVDEVEDEDEDVNVEEDEIVDINEEEEDADADNQSHLPDSVTQFLRISEDSPLGDGDDEKILAD